MGGAAAAWLGCLELPEGDPPASRVPGAHPASETSGKLALFIVPAVGPFPAFCAWFGVWGETWSVQFRSPYQFISLSSSVGLSRWHFRSVILFVAACV